MDRYPKLKKGLLRLQIPDPTEKQFVFPGWAMTHHLAWIILPLLVVGCSGEDRSHRQQYPA